MKFIHMADLHLGSPFAGLPASEAAKRYSGQFDVLDAALRTAASSRARTPTASSKTKLKSQSRSSSTSAA